MFDYLILFQPGINDSNLLIIIFRNKSLSNLVSNNYFIIYIYILYNMRLEND
jgi:hypothetical protein